MNFDANVPAQLKEVQQWFAGIITQPIDAMSRIHPIAPSGLPIKQEAQRYITPNAMLEPYQRMQIYNQQYWWRLLNILHENFPLVTALFGYADFNRDIGVPYLCKYPANHWSLNHLGDRLAIWLEEDYHAPDRPLIAHAAAVDLAFNANFFAKKYPPLNLEANAPENEKGLASKKLHLQPCVKTFLFPYDLLSFRYQVLQHNPDFWMNNAYPSLERGQPPYAGIVYRNIHNQMAWEILNPIAYQILQLFKKGANIENVCEWIETQPREIVSEARSNLHLWFQEWTLKEWLY